MLLQKVKLSSSSSSSFFFFTAKWYSIASMSHSYFIHSSTDGHLGCFHIVAIVDNAVKNIGVLMFFQITVLGFFSYIPRSGIAGLKGRAVLQNTFLFFSFFFFFFWCFSVLTKPVSQKCPLLFPGTHIFPLHTELCDLLMCWDSIVS